MADRVNALIDTFELDAEVIRDGFSKAIAVYEYPFVDGADTEDLGRNAYRGKLRCFFLGERYASHKDFLSHLDQRELFEFLHPDHGLIMVRIPAVHVHYDDRLETAEIDIEMVGDRSKQETPGRSTDVESLVVGSFIDGQSDMMSALSSEMQQVIGPPALTILSKDLDPNLGIVEQLTGLTTQARGYMKTVDGWVGELVADLADVATPANALTQIVNYPANVIGRVAGALARTVERYAIARETLRTAPERYLRSLRLGLADVVSRAESHDGKTTSNGLARITRVAVAQRLAVEAASLYSKDEDRRRQLRQSEQTPRFDRLGRYQASEQTVRYDRLDRYQDSKQVVPVMAAGELERSLSLVRVTIQEAIDQARAGGGDNIRLLPALKAMAEGLADHVGEIKLERDRLLAVVLDNPMPLHLVCLRYGLSYRYAERLLAVNDIPYPNFTEGEVQVYAG